jgi:hypothetical protein
MSVFSWPNENKKEERKKKKDRKNKEEKEKKGEKEKKMKNLFFSQPVEDGKV